MASHYTHWRTSNLCVDLSSERLITMSKFGDSDAALVYPMEMEPTVVPGYYQDWEITCAQCEGVLGWRCWHPRPRARVRVCVCA